MTVNTLPQGNAPALSIPTPPAAVVHPAPILSGLLARFDLVDERWMVVYNEDGTASESTQVPPAIYEWLMALMEAGEAELVIKPATCRECGAPAR